MDTKGLVPNIEIVILSEAKNLFSLARARKQQVPSLRSGQALRCAQDDKYYWGAQQHHFQQRLYSGR